MISQWTSIWVFNKTFNFFVPPALWSSQLWGDQRAGPALWSPQNPLVPLPWHPRQLIYRTGLTTSLCSMSLHQQHKLQQEKKVDELGSKSLFLAAEVSSPIYSTFHACSRRKHHIFSISLGIYSPVSCKNIHRH